jgi:hypothetical protein
VFGSLFSHVLYKKVVRYAFRQANYIVQSKSSPMFGVIIEWSVPRCAEAL